MIQDFLFFINEAASLFPDPDPWGAGGTRGAAVGGQVRVVRAPRPVCAGPGGFLLHSGSEGLD